MGWTHTLGTLVRALAEDIALPVLLGETHYSHSASLRAYMIASKFHAGGGGGNPTLDKRLIRGGAEIMPQKPK